MHSILFLSYKHTQHWYTLCIRYEHAVSVDMKPLQHIGNTQRRDFGGENALIKMLTASLITKSWLFEMSAAYGQIKTMGLHYHVPHRIIV